MKTKQRAFTLVELLVVVAISSILLLIATDRFVGDSFRANATYNQRVDVQTGVKTSMDNIKSILKRAVQVHLVGKEVYMEDMNLQRLDIKYNYIAFRKDANGNRFLANIVYDKSSRQFNVLPLTAGDKKDIMTGDNISYNLEFYKNDNNYRKKLEKDMLNITITGKSAANVLGQGINDEFELSEDIQLPNVNQVLLSRHLQGGIDKITAFAYDNGVIQPGKKGSGGKVGFVFVMDSSASMKFNMVDKYRRNDSAYPFKIGSTYRLGYVYRYGTSSSGYGLYRYKNDHVRPEVYTENDVNNPDSEAATRKIILGSAMVNTFLPKVHDMAVAKNLQITSYMFDYNYGLQNYSTGRNTHEIANQFDYSEKYFTTLEMARRRGYGPYNLESSTGFNQAKDLVLNKADMKLKVSDHAGETPAYGQATNTGFALLTALEILQQMKDQGIESRYMILLTDGVPTSISKLNGYAFSDNNKLAKNRAYYNYKRPGSIKEEYDENRAMDYVREVTNSANGNNDKGLYKKAYLIGFSGVDSEKRLLGFPDASGNVPSNSIAAALASTGNVVQTYDAYNKTALDEALEAIVTDIGVSLGVFDGPDKMR